MGPIWQKPMEWGADVVCYSATKYLSGHSDLIAGVTVGKKEHISAGKDSFKKVRHCAWLLNPFEIIKTKTIKR